MQEIVSRVIDLEKLLSSKSYFLLGPRQTGKTLLIKHALSGCKTYNLLKTDVFHRLANRPSLIREEITSDDKIVVIDEIQKLPELLNEVQILIEEKNIRFLLTGSSARKLRRQGVNLLGGRARIQHIHPFTSYELQSGYDLDKIMHRGLIPGIYFSDAADLDLDSYIGTYLQQEIMAEGFARNLSSFSRALEVLAFCHGEQINYNKLSSDAGIARTTLQDYFQVMQDSLILHELPAWKKTNKRKAQSTAKFYFFDWGIVRRMQKITEIPRKSIIFGKAFESILYHELKTFCDYCGSFDLHYWRSQQQDEVDFILDNRVAIEVKSSSHVLDRDLKGLIKLKEEKLLSRYIVVSLDERQRRPLLDKEIEIIPWREFLTMLWQREII